MFGNDKVHFLYRSVGRLRSTSPGECSETDLSLHSHNRERGLFYLGALTSVPVGCRSLAVFVKALRVGSEQRKEQSSTYLEWYNGNALGLQRILLILVNVAVDGSGSIWQMQTVLALPFLSNWSLNTYLT